MLAICLIIMAWVVEMPLWLSILFTVGSGLSLIADTCGLIAKQMK